MSSIDSFFDALEDEDVPQPWTTPGPVAQRPPRLLLTLLGDYWWQRTESLPSAAIVGLLAEFGVSDSAARAALSRLTRNGLLVTSRSGRRTFVRLSRRAADVLDDGGRRIFSFGATPAPWDGMWSLVAFSIPEEHRSARDELRKELRWLGFAPLYDGLWVCPRDHAGDVMARLKDLGISTATAFRATALPAVTAAAAARARAAAGAADGAGGGAGDGRHPGPRLGPDRPARPLPGVHRIRRPAPRPDGGGRDHHRRRPGRADPGDERMARVPGHGPRPALRAAPARRGRGRPPATCSSPATTCSARSPPAGSGRSSPATAPTWPAAPPTTAPSSRWPTPTPTTSARAGSTARAGKTTSPPA